MSPSLLHRPTQNLSTLSVQSFRVLRILERIFTSTCPTSLVLLPRPHLSLLHLLPSQAEIHPRPSLLPCLPKHLGLHGLLKVLFMPSACAFLHHTSIPQCLRPRGVHTPSVPLLLHQTGDSASSNHPSVRLETPFVCAIS